MSRWKVLLGDCIEQMKGLADNSFDSCVCDPPYALNLRAAHNNWDTFENPRVFQKWCKRWAKEVLRILKPGGYLLAFGGSRTYHRLAAGIEDAGFECRDTLFWMYGTGYSKFQNVSKAIDNHLGKEPKVVGEKRVTRDFNDVMSKTKAKLGKDKLAPGHASKGTVVKVTAPVSKEAKQWDGWHTALRPSVEPIVCFRKPLEGTTADNVLKYGTGALNIDATRIKRDRPIPVNVLEEWSGFGEKQRPEYKTFWNEKGGWPANVLIQHEMGCTEDSCVPVCPVDILEHQRSGSSVYFHTFRYCLKPTKTERDLGMDDFPVADTEEVVGRKKESAGAKNAAAGAGRSGGVRNQHPTLKPIAILRYLVRLVTRKNGKVLDPFSGSGTCGMACMIEGFEYLGIEKEKRYRKWGKARIAYAYEYRKLLRNADKPDTVSKAVEQTKAFKRTLFGPRT